MTRDGRIVALSLCAGLPGALVALRLLWLTVPSQATRWTLTAIIVGALVGFSLLLKEQVVRPLQTLSNMLAAIREGDYSLRGGRATREDSFGQALVEANAIADALRGQRLDSLEAAAFLGTVMSEIEVAVFAFDHEDRLRFVNRAGVALLGGAAQPAPGSAAAGSPVAAALPEGERLLGRTAASLQLADALATEGSRTLEAAFAGGLGRFEARTRLFRQDGLPHKVLVLSDLRRALREEERQAWQRLIRVLSHEINNSLTPIQSIAQSLQTLLGRAGLPGEKKADLEEGLQVIAGRADAVARFMASYARLARLPPPRRKPVDVPALVRRIAGLETRVHVQIEPGPQLSLAADGDQLDQLLINLVTNAADAALETGGGVTVSWRALASALELVVRDDGPGIAETRNLFVPFFTTKPQGSGIGLVLSRQIAEAHGGTLQLRNRAFARGCEAVLQLPL